MSLSFRYRTALALAIAMLAIAIIIVGRITIFHRAPATNSLTFDLLFAAFFALRGLMHLASVRRAAARAAPEADIGPR